MMHDRALEDAEGEGMPPLPVEPEAPVYDRGMVTEVVFKSGFMMTVCGDREKVLEEIQYNRDFQHWWHIRAVTMVKRPGEPLKAPSVYSVDPWEISLIGVSRPYEVEEAEEEDPMKIILAAMKRKDDPEEPKTKPKRVLN
jgi:hypothetical protein